MSRTDESTAGPGGPVEIGPRVARLVPPSVVDAAWQALRGVFDPELCLDVVSLGLVYDVREEHGGVVVEMTLTTPGCPVSEGLPEMARASVREAIGPGYVQVHVVWDPPWNPSMMDTDVASALGLRPR